MTDSLVVHKRQPAEIIEITTKSKKKRLQYEGAGRWINEAVCQVMLMKPSKWYSMKELSFLAFRSASSSNQTKTRRRISTLFHYMFRHHGRLFIREYELRVDDCRLKDQIRKTELKGRNIIARIKIVEQKDIDRADNELSEMSHRNEISRQELLAMRDALKRLAAPSEP